MQDGAKYREILKENLLDLSAIIFMDEIVLIKDRTTGKLENSCLHTTFIQPWVSRPEAKCDSIKH